MASISGPWIEYRDFMKPCAALLLLAALASGCAGPAVTAPSPAPAETAAAPLPRVVYYVINEA